MQKGLVMGIGDYFGAAGDMFSGSQDPDEQNRALEREEQKRRREQDKEQARLLREQQAQQESQQRELQRSPDAQSTPKAAVIPEGKQAFPKADPDDPFMGIPEARRNEMQLHKFDDNRDIPDYSGFPLTPDARQEYVERRKRRLNDHTQDMKDVLFMMDLRRDPAFKDQVEKESRKLQQWMKVEPGSLFDLPIPKSRNLLDRVNPDDQEKRYRTMEYKPGRDAAKAIPAIALEAQDKSKAIPANNILEQTAHVNDPQDESMMGAYVRLGQALTNAFSDDKAVTGYGRSEVGHSDQSYAEGEKVLGEYVGDGLGVDKDVHGKDRSRPVGHPDMSYGPGLGSPTQNFGPGSAVTGKDNQPVGAPNMSYLSDWDNENSRKLPLKYTTEGIKKGYENSVILFLHTSALMGDLVNHFTGGDPKAIRQVQELVRQHDIERQKLEPMTPDQVYVEGNPDKTMQNVTRYLYQELGNKAIELPVYYVLGHLKTFAQVAGVSSTVLSAQIYGDVQLKTGEGKPIEAITYGIPLGVMSALALPFKTKLPVNNAGELKSWLNSVVMDGIIHGIQGEGKSKAVESLSRKNKKDSDLE